MSVRSLGSGRGPLRGERLDAGVVLCRPLSFLAARTALDERCLHVLAPGADAAGVRDHLAAVSAVAAGDPAAGLIAALEQAARFHWLTAPSSTVVQPGEVHTGLTDDPAAMLDRFFTALVRR